jgi:uncharacterized RDD family membrane protein YckC
VELEDRITLATPEGIELGLVLAGAGSRFIAGTIDLTLEFVLLALAGLVAFLLVGGGIGVALFAMASFATFYLYNVLFELLASGRTPGKRITHLRVVREEGTPVDLPASTIRNLLRLIDWLPFAYLIGLVMIVITRRNQRLGDLAAGTLVIRDVPARSEETSRPDAHEALDTSGWDVSAVSVAELATVRRFLERREQLDGPARRQLAYQLEQGLRPKVAGGPEELDPERFLEELARAKGAR